MKTIAVFFLLLISPVCMAVPCPSLEFVQHLHFDSIVKVSQGMLNAGANLNGVTDSQNRRWQFVLAPIFSDVPSDAEQFLKNIDIPSAESFHTTVRGVKVDECLYSSSRTYHELHGFYCGNDLCFKHN